MGNLSSLVELDDFQIYKNFIKRFILEDQDLFRLIYFCNKNPFQNIYPENPFKIFGSEKEDENDNHGVVLFKQKNPEILNYGAVIILVDCETTKLGNSNLMDNLYIIFRIVLKSDAVQELEDDEGNTVNRINAIAELINNNFDNARVGSIGKIRRQSFAPLSINEGNCGATLIFKTSNLSNRLLENANR